MNDDRRNDVYGDLSNDGDDLRMGMDVSYRTEDDGAHGEISNESLS